MRDSLSEQLNRIENAIDALHVRMVLMSAELDRLTTEVTETRTVMQSAVALIEGLAEQIRLLRNDPIALAALADSLDAGANTLAAAVAANTPAPPVP